MAKQDWRNGVDWDVFVRDGYRCVYCELELTTVKGQWDLFAADHLVPTITGRLDSLLNIVTACQGCNKLKGNFDPTENGTDLLTDESKVRLIQRARDYIAAERRKWLTDVEAMRKEIVVVPKQATGSHFYRYQTCEHLEWLKPIIIDHTLYIPLVSQLNDPLDCKPKINPMSEHEMVEFLRNDYLRRNPVPALDLLQAHVTRIRQQIKTLGLDWFLQQLTGIMYRQMDEFRVYPLSKRFDNFSLWAKYADSHRGYCLEFANEGPLFEKILEVTYGNYPPFDMNDSKQRSAVFLTYKSRDWCNEEEVRLISKRGSGPYVEIKPTWLTRIILGKDMPREQSAQIREWASQRTPELTVVQAHFRRTTSRASIDPGGRLKSLGF